VPHLAPGRELVDRQRRRQPAEGVDLLLQGGDLLLGCVDRVSSSFTIPWLAS
jgi:hypothetical protein